jgi:hypothetical protein
LTTQVLTGLLLLVLPLAYNGLYTLLARGFDYPDILRQPTGQVLERFAAGGSRLVLTWWGFAMSAVLLAPAVVLVSATLADADPTVLALATAIGLLAALVQFLGLVRWPFAVPHLARLAGDPATTPATRDAVEVVFQTLNRYLGVAVGEHLGYLFTGVWTALAGVALIQSDVLPPAVRGRRAAAGAAVCARVARVRRPLRGPWLEARRQPGPVRLHRLVGVAAGPGYRPAGHRLTSARRPHRRS